MFAGDLGAYSYGFIIALLVIVFFGQYPEFVTWQAVLVLFYPAIEIIFTVLRRLLTRQNPITADRLHLHQLLFFRLQKICNTNWKANAMATVCLLPIWSFASVWLWFFGAQLDLSLTLFGILFNTIAYLLLYFYLSYTQENK